MTTKLPETLEAKVERLVREHLAEQQLAVKAALERAFAMSTTPRATTRRRASYRRRAPTEVADLAEQVFEGVKACPGETMTVIAAHVGRSPRELHRPMKQLKDAGRVRSAGERNFTRYFPMVATRAA
jgi:predicted transcriptional regulator